VLPLQAQLSERPEPGSDLFRKALGLFPGRGFSRWQGYEALAAAYARAGKIDAAKDALAEARRTNPKLTVKWLIEHGPGLPAVLDGLRKAGVPEE
jgi:tetratricopeptide (TPR) repeat protein